MSEVDNTPKKGEKYQKYKGLHIDRDGLDDPPNSHQQGHTCSILVWVLIPFGLIISRIILNTSIPNIKPVCKDLFIIKSIKFLSHLKFPNFKEKIIEIASIVCVFDRYLKVILIF